MKHFNFKKLAVSALAVALIVSGGFASFPNTAHATAGTVNALVVAGGGGGGQGIGTSASRGGGGGAGGYQANSSLSLSPGTYTITVGAGGAGGTGANQNNGSDGNDSSIGSTLVATHGGGGGAGGFGSGTFQNGLVGNNGGSGGGGGSGNCLSTRAGGTGTAGQGNAGSTGGGNCAQDSGGAGGGASGAGSSDTLSGVNRAAGGIGTANSISGSSLTYAVGGRSGGTGTTGAAGTANRGNGGDGATGVQTGFAGGSGVVVIAYPTADAASYTCGGTPTTSGANTICTYTSSGTFTYSAGSGPVYVNRGEGCSAAAVSSIATGAMNVSAGNLLVVYMSGQSSGVDGTIADTAGNTFHESGAIFVGPGNTNYMNIWYAYNVSGNASDVITFTWTSGTAAYAMIGVRQFSGFGTSDPYGSRQTNSGSGTAMNTGTITAGSSAVIFSGVENDSNATITGTNGFTFTNFCQAYFADGYNIVSASTDATANGTSNPWRMIGASFNAPAAAGSGEGYIINFE